MTTRLQTEQAIEHIGAYFLSKHDDEHAFLKANGCSLESCRKCQFIKTMADYIEHREERIKSEMLIVDMKDLKVPASRVPKKLKKRAE